MGSFRVAGMMGDSALGAGVEVTTGGRDRTSSWRGPGLSRWPAQGLPPSQPPFPGKGRPSANSGLQAPSEPHTLPAPPGHTFGTGNCTSVAGLGFAASLAVAMSGGGRKRSLGQVRPGEGMGTGRRQGLGWDCGRHL